MKKIILIFTFLISKFALFAQIEPEEIDLRPETFPFDIAIDNDNNILYLCEDGRVSSKDLSSPNAVIETVSEMDFSRGIAIIDSSLYVAYFGEIFKYDPNTGNLDLIFTLPDHQFPNGINNFISSGGFTTDGTDLFFNEIAVNSSSGVINNVVISKITNLNGTPERVVLDDTLVVNNESDSQFNDLEYSNNKLFFTDSFNNTIRVIDLSSNTPNTSTPFITGLSQQPFGVEVDDNILYISYTDRIARVDASDPSNIIESDLTTVFDNPLFPGDPVEISRLDLGDNNILYVHSFGGGFYTVDLNTILSTTETKPTFETIKLFPNPSEDYIMLSNIKTPTNYTIYSSLGQHVTHKTGTINTINNKIDITALPSGIYFLKTTTNTIKFIKK